MVTYIGRKTGPFLLVYDGGASRGSRRTGLGFSTSELSWCLSACVLGHGFGIGWYYRNPIGKDRPIRTLQLVA